MSDEVQETVGSEAPPTLFLTHADNYVFIDMETWGLDYLNDEPLEVGLCITDLDFRIVARDSWLVWEDWFDTNLSNLDVRIQNGEEEAKIVLDMHTKSGLLAEARKYGEDISIVHRRMLDWLEENGFPADKSIPMVGSNVSFDRIFSWFNFRKFTDSFHYRIIDISTIKMLCMQRNPSMYKRLTETVTPAKKHRVNSDIDDSINEFAFYIKNFIVRER